MGVLGLSLAPVLIDCKLYRGEDEHKTKQNFMKFLRKNP